MHTEYFYTSQQNYTGFLFLTALLRHGYSPSHLADCVIVPIVKPGKNASDSGSYHLIALATTLSKILEWYILIQFSPYFLFSDLQFLF